MIETAFGDFGRQPKSADDFDQLRCRLASPAVIEKWSHGEITVPETINYRTFQPEPFGLFCCRTFGPEKDYQCQCGKYKRFAHRGVICDHCGVEVTKSSERRYRMGHIKLATPVAHVWFLKSVPSRLAMILGITLKELERVFYFDSWLVLDPGITDLEPLAVLNEVEYEEARQRFGDDFEAGIGAEVVYKYLRKLDLEEELTKGRAELVECNSVQKRKTLARRMRLIRGFIDGNVRPEWMTMTVLPVLPPDLRPLVPLEGGRFATSDLNDLYRRVLTRNARLQRMQQAMAPPIIVRNEKRMLQQAVDALLDNGRRGRTVMGNNKRQLKSLSDAVKSKQGRFRQNLLGKRVDYSGRSVIVAGPELRLHQCGLPKLMAVELFRPFVYSELRRRGVVSTIRAARREVDQLTPEVWDCLEVVIHQHPVLLNRAPTLHRLGIQAFEPLLVEGRAIQLHPLVCAAYNADFDGDQMAVHIPLTLEAQLEARVLMMSTNNILSPANGKPVIVPTKDVIIGLYYMTRLREDVLGAGSTFADYAEVTRAYSTGAVHIQAPVSTYIVERDIDGTNPRRKHVETTVGRVLLWRIIPDGIEFSEINKTMASGDISRLLDLINGKCSQKRTVVFADRLMYMGFEHATKSGLSLAISDLAPPSDKNAIVAETEAKVAQIQKAVQEGRITESEKSNAVRDAWDATTKRVSDVLMTSIGEETYTANGETKQRKSFNPVFMYMDSGARGSEAQIRQLAGMRGLMAKPDGSIIETPITASFREGLSVLQYFISTHGARKGLADTALKTANAGYLTRRLVDIAQDAVITHDDCGVDHGITVTAVVKDASVQQTLGERLRGRTLVTPLEERDGTAIVGAGELVERHHVDRINQSGNREAQVRSPVTCQIKGGICAKCYGLDLARGVIVGKGETVGVVAAQSIGEPGTQLTMRTFHIGGAATQSTVTDSISVAKEGETIFNNVVTVTDRNGHLVVVNRAGTLAIIDERGSEIERHPLPYGTKLSVKTGQKVAVGDNIAQLSPRHRLLVSTYKGKAVHKDFEEGVTVRSTEDFATGLVSWVMIPEKSRASSAAQLKPAIVLEDERGETVTEFILEDEASVKIANGAEVLPGDEISRVAVQSAGTRDITGGLPRVEDIFEARTPKDLAYLAPISGTVRLGGTKHRKKRILVYADESNETADVAEVAIPGDKLLAVSDGTVVERGDRLADGAVAAQDCFELLGAEAVANQIVTELQEVYRGQGVEIADKHIEVIVRQMMRKVDITDPGDTHLLPDEQVDLLEVEDINARIEKQGLKPAQYRRVILGLTKASLATPSFMAASSFQETTRVLSDAAVNGKIDKLSGLKENVMIGRIIPAGTGYAYHETRRREVSSVDIEAEFAEELKRSAGMETFLDADGIGA